MKQIYRLATAMAALALTSQANAGANLVTNGDFSAGNSGFSSGYAYVPQPSSPATGPGSPPTSWNETTYGVGPNADLYHALWYNVSAPAGSGDYMIVNGGIVNPLATVWSQTVTVAPHTWYNFSAQVASIYPTNPATLNFYAGALQVGSTFDAGAVGAWGTFSGGWYSGAATSVVLKIVDTNTIASGNDFGVDHISLSVPEASTWVMMLAGFAGLGFLGYRRGKAAPAAA
jgi:hypothetical protein